MDCTVIHYFLSRVSTLTRDIDIAILSVCLSVRNTLVLYENGLTYRRYRHSFFSPYGSPIILVYQHRTFSRNSDGVTPSGGAKYRWGIQNSRFSTNMSLYLANDTRYRHSYYGRRIGTSSLCDLSNGAISNDLERTLTLFSRSHHSLTLNISQMATDTAIVTIEGE